MGSVSVSHERKSLVATLTKNIYWAKKVATLSLKITVDLIFRIGVGFRMS